MIRWTVQDWRTSPLRVRLSGDPQRERARLLYLELLFAIYEAGGPLPPDPEELAALAMIPASDVPALLEMVLRTGRLSLDAEGRLTNRRALGEIALESEFRAEQTAKGLKSGRVRRERAAAARNRSEQRLSGGSAAAQPVLNPVAVAVAVAVAEAEAEGNGLPAAPAADLGMQNGNDNGALTRTDQRQNGNGSSVSKPKRKPKADLAPWMVPYAEAWRAACGGTLHPLKIGLLKGEHDAAGAEACLAAFKRYLGATDPQYLSCRRFVETFGRWTGAGQPRPQPARGAVDQAAQAERLRAWAEKTEAEEAAKAAGGSNA